jgi:hypothetical protein
VNYDERLAAQLNSLHGNLYFPDSSVHSYLDGIAHDAFGQGEAAGCLAALTIWHQLTEEILRLLYRYSQVLIKAALYPAKLGEKDLQNESLGSLIQIHKQCVQYDRKSVILSSAIALNNLRNDLFHDITQYPSEADIIRKAEPCRGYFQQLFGDWQIAMKWFDREFARIKNRKEIASLLQKHPKTGRRAK